MNRHLKGCLLIIIAMSLFSFNGIVVRLLDLHPIIILFFGSFITTMVLLSYFILRNRSYELKLKKNSKYAILLGIGLTGNLVFYFLAFKSTTLANSVLSHYTAPIFAAVFAVILLREKLDKITIFSLIIAFIGLFIISAKDLSFNSNDLMGIIFGTLSGLSYGFSIVVAKKLTQNYGFLTILFYEIFIVMILLSPFVLFIDFYLSLNIVLILIGFALFMTLLPTIFLLKGIKEVKAQHAGIIAYAEVLFTIIYAFIFLDEIPTFLVVIGGILIISSGYLVLGSEAKRNPKKT